MADFLSYSKITSSISSGQTEDLKYVETGKSVGFGDFVGEMNECPSQR